MFHKNGRRLKFPLVFKFAKPDDHVSLEVEWWWSLYALQRWWHCCLSGVERQRWTGHLRTRGTASSRCPDLQQASALTLGFPTQVAQAPEWSSGGYEGSVPQTRKHQLQWAGEGIAVSVLSPWPKLHLSQPLLRKGVGVMAEKGRGCSQLGEEVVSKDGWEGKGGEEGVQGWVGDKRGLGKFKDAKGILGGKKGELRVTCSNN